MAAFIWQIRCLFLALLSTSVHTHSYPSPSSTYSPTEHTDTWQKNRDFQTNLSFCLPKHSYPNRKGKIESRPLLIIYCCVTDYHKLSEVKQTTFIISKSERWKPWWIKEIRNPKKLGFHFSSKRLLFEREREFFTLPLHLALSLSSALLTYHNRSDNNWGSHTYVNLNNIWLLHQTEKFPSQGNILCV